MVESLILALGISFGIQVIFFIFAAAFKTDKVTDFSYGLSFFIITLYFYFASSMYHAVQAVVTILISVWAMRLASYLVIRIFKTKKDERFNEIRDHFWKFATFWFFQAVTVWVILLPAIVLLLTNNLSINPAFFVGVIIWAVGFFIESLADQQKFTFKKKPENKEKWIEFGIWKYSRHPNYFGEILCWVGIFIIALPYLSGWLWLTAVSPLFITFLLCFVSGIPPLEKKYDKKFAGNSEYQKYKKRTSILVPLWPER